MLVNPIGPVLSSPGNPNPWNVTITSIGLSSDASALSALVVWLCSPVCECTPLSSRLFHHCELQLCHS